MDFDVYAAHSISIGSYMAIMMHAAMVLHARGEYFIDKNSNAGDA